MPAERVEQHELGQIVAWRNEAKAINAKADAAAKEVAPRLAKYGFEGGMYRAQVNGGVLAISRVDGVAI